MSIRPARSTDSPRRLAGRFAAGCGAWLLGLAAPLSAAVYTVGGAGCTHPDLLSALVAAATNPGTDQIRLLSGSSHQGPFFVNTDGLTITGGYASCSATTPTGSSTLLGDNANRALFVSTSGAMFLSRLSITGGTVAGNGGGILVQGSGSLVLQDVLVFGNHVTGAGGNLYVNGSGNVSVQLSGASLLASGTAQNGGGLACSGTALMYFDSAVAVANNSASADGGGVHLSSGCSLDSRATSSTGGGIVSNHANGNGGGVMVAGGSLFATHAFAGTGLAEISGNTAVNNGGGLAVVGSGSRAVLQYVRLATNHAGNVGGGLLADNLAVVGITRADAFGVCADALRCQVVSDNSAAVGGAFFVDSASLNVDGAYLERNSATISQPVGSVRGGGGGQLTNAVVAANDGAEPLLVDDANSSLVLGNVTVVGNLNVGAGVIRLGGGASGSNRVRVLSSVFDQAGALFAPGAPTAVGIQIDCVMSRFSPLFSGLPGQSVTRATTVADPRLASSTAGYLLLADSPAIDFCDLAAWTGPLTDVNWDRHDLDDPAHSGGLGLRDLGADEHTHDIHSDDFELGTLVLWNGVLITG